jgi:hypothetical protein
MAHQPLVTVGAHCRLFVNGIVYSVVQSVSIKVNQGVYSTFGINSPDAQSIDSGQRTVTGSVKGIRIKNSGGLQSVNLIPSFGDIAAGNFVSLRLEDRRSQETLWSVPKCRVSEITETVQIKGVYQVSFDWIGQQVFWPLDLS